MPGTAENICVYDIPSRQSGRFRSSCPACGEGGGSVECEVVEVFQMRTPTCAVFATLLSTAVAQAQVQSENSINSPQAATPIAGIDNAALARSARASKLIGSTVYQGDNSVGRIEDVLVDLDQSTLMAVVISVGGFLGMGDKLVAVPVTQIKVGAEAKFTTDLTKQQMTNAPAFDFGKLK
jgi:sporulation protein YlmC with PRC-barrel domain